MLLSQIQALTPFANANLNVTLWDIYNYENGTVLPDAQADPASMNITLMCPTPARQSRWQENNKCLSETFI